jgi:hypothetical protein
MGPPWKGLSIGVARLNGRMSVTRVLPRHFGLEPQRARSILFESLANADTGVLQSWSSSGYFDQFKRRRPFVSATRTSAVHSAQVVTAREGYDTQAGLAYGCLPAKDMSRRSVSGTGTLRLPAGVGHRSAQVSSIRPINKPPAMVSAEATVSDRWLRRRREKDQSWARFC